MVRSEGGGGLVVTVSETGETILTITSNIASIRGTDFGVGPLELKSQIHPQV